MGKINEIKEEVKQSFGVNAFITTIKPNTVEFDSEKDSFTFLDPVDVPALTINGEPITPGGNFPSNYDVEDFSLSIGNDDKISGTINVGIGNQIDAPDAEYDSVIMGNNNSMSLHSSDNVVIGSKNETGDLGEDIIIGNHNSVGDDSYYSVIIGNTTSIQGVSTDAVIVGDRTYNDGKQSVVVGANARNYGDASIAIGYEAQAHNDNAMALGAMAIAEEGEIALSFGIDGATYQARQIKLKLDNGTLKISFDNGSTWGTINVTF